MDTGPLKLCSKSCNDEGDCSKYDGQEGKFLCNAQHQCVTPDAYQGSVCDKDSDCAPGLVCARNPASAEQGNCMPPCDPARRCAARGGVPHTCLDFPKGLHVCYPGYFGVTCASDDQCLPSLTCRPLGAALGSICTNLCASDDDCHKNRWTRAGSCQPLEGMGIKVCLVPPQPTGAMP
jgi:hypothetical protein